MRIVFVEIDIIYIYACLAYSEKHYGRYNLYRLKSICCHNNNHYDLLQWENTCLFKYKCINIVYIVYISWAYLLLSVVLPSKATPIFALHIHLTIYHVGVHYPHSHLSHEKYPFRPSTMVVLPAYSKCIHTTIRFYYKIIIAIIIIIIYDVSARFVTRGRAHGKRTHSAATHNSPTFAARTSYFLYRIYNRDWLIFTQNERENAHRKQTSLLRVAQPSGAITTR